MKDTIFKEFSLDQQTIAELVGAHYLPMRHIKKMRATTTFKDFKKQYQELEKILEQHPSDKIQIITLFLADNQGKGKGCTDFEELHTIYKILKREAPLEKAYKIQKQAAKQRLRGYSAKK